MEQTTDFYNAKYLGSFPFHSETQNWQYGYYSMTVSQDNLLLSKTFARDSIDKSFATIGGLASFIYVIISLVIGNYQDFSFENALHNKLYT